MNERKGERERNVWLDILNAAGTIRVDLPDDKRTLHANSVSHCCDGYIDAYIQNPPTASVRRVAVGSLHVCATCI